jgi:hypothetical protein
MVLNEIIKNTESIKYDLITNIDCSLQSDITITY